MLGDRDAAIAALVAERDKLRAAIAKIGFSVMETSGAWSIHGVREYDKKMEADDLVRVRRLIELEAENNHLWLQLDENLAAWDSEENSVKEEHADLIAETRTVVDAYAGSSSMELVDSLERRIRAVLEKHANSFVEIDKHGEPGGVDHNTITDVVAEILGTVAGNEDAK